MWAQYGGGGVGAETQSPEQPWTTDKFFQFQINPQKDAATTILRCKA